MDVRFSDVVSPIGGGRSFAYIRLILRVKAMLGNTSLTWVGIPLFSQELS